MRKFVLAILLALVVSTLIETKSQAAVSFNDVVEGQRASKEIYYLAEGKIISGDSSGNFSPNREVTRAEAAAMLGRALNLDGTKKATQFADVPSESFASGYIKSAVDLKIISGYSDGSFKPNNLVTRGEMALLVSRAFEYKAENSIVAASELMNRGIAQGISEGDFGYYLNIKRADFSVFLARAINYKLRIVPVVPFSGELEVNADILNVRTGPSTNYEKLGSLSLGTKVEGAYAVGDWWYIRTDELEGLVHGMYLNGLPTPVETGETGDIEEDKTLSSQVIVLDPGHGGKDPGAVAFGLFESTVVLDTALRVKSLLEKTPLTTQLTRETDVYLTLDERVAFAKQANANAFISLHSNAFNSKANGTETYYYSAGTNPNVEDSKKLATFIQNRLIEAWKLTDRGVKKGNFYVIRETTMPAVLVELGFIDNVTDHEKLKSESWRQKAAEAIYYGILDYYKDKGFDTEELYNI